MIPVQVSPYAYISALKIGNKNKAIVAFLALMNLYTSREEEVFFMVVQAEAYIEIIELLVVCLQEK